MLRALAAKLPEDVTMIAMRDNSSRTIMIEEDGCCRDLFLDDVIVDVIVVVVVVVVA